MTIYYFVYSFIFFVKQAFTKKHYQIIFYAPQHFNRGKENENLFLKELLDSCRIHGISFLYFEEPDLLCKQKRSDIAIPFDFIYYVIILLRKFIQVDISFVNTDKKIGRIIKKIFFRKITFDNYITVSQSMLSFFNGVNSDAKKFDLQHGTIHANKEDYLCNGLVGCNLKQNNVHLLLSGNGYKSILLSNDTENYFKNHIKVIGSSVFGKSINIDSKINKNVLVSLQFTNDHSKSENDQIADILEKKIKNNPSFTFYLRNHPRFNADIDLSRFLCLSNVSLSKGYLKDNFQEYSFHLTVYSTVAFEAGLNGIPTCFLKLDYSKMSIFDTQYAYPFYKDSLSDLYNNYSICALETKKWAQQFYQLFCKDSFLQVLK